MICQHCGKEIADHARYCRYCGLETTNGELDVPPKKENRVGIIIAALFVCIVVAGGGYAFYTSVFDKPEENAEKADNIILHYAYQVEDGRIDIGTFPAVYADGKGESISDYKVYIGGRCCRTTDEGTKISGLEGKEKILVQWEKDNKTFEAEKTIRIVPAAEEPEWEASPGERELFRSGLLPATTEGDNWGYIDKKGNYKIKPQFEVAGAFSEGLACVCKNGKYGFVNTSGEFAIKAKFDYASGFHNGIARIAKGEEGAYRYGYIDTSGNYIIKPMFFYAGSYRGKLAPVQEKKGGEIKYIDQMGNTVLAGGLDDGTEFYEDGYAIVMKDGKYGCIDESGHYAIGLETDGIDQYGKNLGYRYDLAFDGPDYVEYERTLFCEKLVPVEKGNVVGYMDTSGNWIIKPKFYSAKGFHEGKAAVTLSQNGKYGYIDNTGSLMIEPQYDTAGSFREGMALVTIEEGWDRNPESGYIDESGQYKVKPNEEYHYLTSVYDGKFFVSLEDGVDAVMDTTQSLYGGTEDSPRFNWRYQNGVFKGGYSLIVEVSEDESEWKMGVVDLNGTVVVPMEFQMLWGTQE